MSAQSVGTPDLPARFVEYSPHDVVVMEGSTFAGFQHVTLDEHSDEAR